MHKLLKQYNIELLTDFLAFLETFEGSATGRWTTSVGIIGTVDIGTKSGGSQYALRKLTGVELGRLIDSFIDDRDKRGD